MARLQWNQICGARRPRSGVAFEGRWEDEFPFPQQEFSFWSPGVYRIFYQSEFEVDEALPFASVLKRK